MIVLIGSVLFLYVNIVAGLECIGEDIDTAHLKLYSRFLLLDV